MQGEPREPVHPDPADAAGVEPRPAPAATVRGLALETASVRVLETGLVVVPVLVLGLVKVKALVLDWAQGWARGPLRQQRPQPVVEPSAGHLSLIHISEPTRRYAISYAVFCLKKKK